MHSKQGEGKEEGKQGFITQIKTQIFRWKRKRLRGRNRSEVGRRGQGAKADQGAAVRDITPLNSTHR